MHGKREKEADIQPFLSMHPLTHNYLQIWYEDRADELIARAEGREIEQENVPEEEEGKKDEEEEGEEGGKGKLMFTHPRSGTRFGTILL